MNSTDLLGLSEIAELYGVHRNTANNWSRQRDFPLPIAQLKMGPVWSKTQVVAWRTPAAQQRWKLACGSCAAGLVTLLDASDSGIKLKCYACDEITILEIHREPEHGLGVTLVVKPKEA